jgi:vitamin B12 transporter
MTPHTNTPARHARRLLAIALAGLAASAAASITLAQNLPATGSSDETVNLERYVVSASRVRQDAKTTPSSITVLSPAELQRVQITDLRDALHLAPGVNVVETGGALGSMTEVTIRGASSSHTLFLIDGIRVNSEDPTNSYANLIGAGGLNGTGRVEVLRGAQSILYGSSAIGGVVAIETTRGDGAPAIEAGAAGGSFATLGGAFSASGSVDLNSIAAGSWGPSPLHYSASVSGIRTDNDRDGNFFSQLAFATRLEVDVSKALTIGATYRNLHNDYTESGNLHDPSSGGHADLRFSLATLYAEARPLDTLASRLTLGLVNSEYDWDRTAWGSAMDASRRVIDWQNTWQVIQQLQLVAGLNAEWSRYDNASVGHKLKDNVRSAYVSANATPVKNLVLALGARVDDYDTFRRHATWRAGVAYRVEQTATTLRANYGTGYNAPSPNYVLGGGWYEPSPDLKPEKSKGWDVGVEQDVWDNRLSIGATWFQNDFKDKFNGNDWHVTGYLYTNIPGATTKGVELSVVAHPIQGLSVRAAYTHLNARDNAGTRLTRQPRHTATADVNYQITPEWLAGAGVTSISDRPNDKYYDPSIPYPNSNVSQPMSDYILARLYTSYEIRPGLTLRARVENLFDKEYQTVADYPGLPIGVFAGIEWKF